MAFRPDDAVRDRQEWLLWLERHAILPIKWLTLLLCIALLLIDRNTRTIPVELFRVIVFYAAANLLFSYLFYFNRVEHNQVRMISLVSFAIDVAAVTLFVYLTGGINSQFYILYFLVILRGTGFFDTALTNFIADVLISVSYVAAIFLHSGDLEDLTGDRFIIQLCLVWGVILMSWLLFRIQNQLKDRLLAANTTLSIQQEFDKDMLAAISNSVIATDRDMRIIRINQAARQMLALPTPAEGEDVYVLKNELGRLLEELRQGARDIRDLIMEVTAHDGRKVTLRVTANAIVSDAGEFLGTVCIFEDLSQVRRLEEQLFRSEKLASVGELAAGVAHEIGNPISIIKSCADLLCDQLKAELSQPDQNGGVPRKVVAEVAEDVAVIAGEAERCNTIVRELLSFSHPEPGALLPYDVNEAVERAVSLVSYQKMETPVRLESDLAEGLPMAETDANLLSQALVNLLLNALQSMTSEGVVRARTSLHRQGRKAMVRIDIIDQGCGIPAEKLDKIFSPFYTTKEKGTGLGLSIVHRIVERLNGELKVESTVGKGSTFTVLLPAVMTEI